MTKKKKATSSNNRNTLYGLLAVGLVIFAVLSASLLSGNIPIADSIEKISPASYQSNYIEDNTSHVLIDVRTPEEFASGHIAGAINIPVEALQNRLSEVPSGEPIVVYCRSGNRSAQASQILASAGYSDIHDLGGLIDWASQGYPVE